MKRKIVAVNGTIGSGKNAFSEPFIDNGFTQMSFAKNLKDSVAAIFGWDREMLEGITKESRAIREIPDAYWCKKLGRDDVSPRWVLQYYGTDVVRRYLNNDIWVYSLEKSMQDIKGDIIISDCRFPNELTMIRENGGVVIEVQRELPEWYNDAYRYNVRGGDLPEALKTIHPSEWAWIGINKPDYVIQNNSTLEELNKQAEWIIHGIKDKN